VLLVEVIAASAVANVSRGTLGLLRNHLSSEVAIGPFPEGSEFNFRLPGVGWAGMNYAKQSLMHLITPLC